MVVAIGFVVFAGGSGDEEQKAAAPAQAPKGQAGQERQGPVTLIGDGSTSDSGAQPGRLKPERLAPGQTPPQFIVFSWDGAGEDDKRLFSHFRQVAKESKAKMTLFLSGVYILPEAKKAKYHPPHKPIGASDIGYLEDDHLRMTIEQLGAAWNEGHEIGTHFNGHFCGPTGGGSWSADDWRSEVEQAKSFVKNWKTNTGWTDLPALPFDYDKELIGGRAPCLEGQKALLDAAPSLGFRYDASSPGGRQVWPTKVNGVWDLPLQQIPLPGRKFEVLSMDYNVMFNQSRTVKGDPAKFKEWEEQAYASYMAGYERAYTGNRAPLMIGNHFEGWNGGIYMKAVERTMRTACVRPDTKCVTFHDLVDWLDAQDPAVLAKLRTYDIGAKPDWATVASSGSQGVAIRDRY
ncbi:hypothetical protein [Embleya sp. NBC_00896]|uniref:hypothetical protein n=1 Tax=Embleya sp. NBC_00896 TaxID=2975961 RepID=UPI003868485F|nr:hypothetical protein OG928_22005 [Embleya sp. NBC_00896]